MSFFNFRRGSYRVHQGILLIFGIALAASSASAAVYKYRCSPVKGNKDAFLSSGYVILNVFEDQIRFQYFDANNVAGETTLSVDVIYSKHGTLDGHSKIAGMNE